MCVGRAARFLHRTNNSGVESGDAAGLSDHHRLQRMRRMPSYDAAGGGGGGSVQATSAVGRARFKIGVIRLGSKARE